MIRGVIFLLMVNWCLPALSQDARKVSVSFFPTINQEINNKVHLTKLKFYISHLSLYNNEMLVWKDNTTAHLIDAENEMGVNLSIKKDIQFNTIKFGLGIDSITNVSGALDGDLDPLKGMYWTWQSGYVNVKFEGIMPNVNKEVRKFEYHLGGYSGDNNSYNIISLEVKNTDSINVSLDLDKFLSNSYVQEHPNIMSPGKDAVDLSKIIASCFSIK